MLQTEENNDWPTIAAIGLLAMCVVTFDHEALGHGSVCLALQGRILALSSSVFRCSRDSGWIALAGPAGNILGGMIALAARLIVPRRAVKLRLFLILVTTFSFFWESGYLMQAMLTRYGDLYFFARWALGSLTAWQCWAGAAVGLGLYLLSARLAARALLGLVPDAEKARVLARTVWLSATSGAALAALAYTGSVKGDLRDAVLEFGLASVALLFIPRRDRRSSNGLPAMTISRSVPVIVVALIVYGAFAVTLGRGLG
ncbi:MAG: hypothetical protein KGJ53_08335 [Alphaproteobacteria bacterium]|nr:hypothetical protein [Alphaproteobacteria bacterium]MDE2163155.1 hypothetical protein [Alphaproteobacteria bacterium]